MDENVLSPHSRRVTATETDLLFKSQHRTPNKEVTALEKAEGLPETGGVGRVRGAPGTEGNSYIVPSALGLNSALYLQSICPVAPLSQHY